jgi:hypothetical protein
MQKVLSDAQQLHRAKTPMPVLASMSWIRLLTRMQQVQDASGKARTLQAFATHRDIFDKSIADHMCLPR